MEVAPDPSFRSNEAECTVPPFRFELTTENAEVPVLDALDALDAITTELADSCTCTGTGAGADPSDALPWAPAPPPPCAPGAGAEPREGLAYAVTAMGAMTPTSIPTVIPRVILAAAAQTFPIRPSRRLQHEVEIGTTARFFGVRRGGVEYALGKLSCGCPIPEEPDARNSAMGGIARWRRRSFLGRPNQQRASAARPKKLSPATRHEEPDIAEEARQSGRPSLRAARSTQGLPA